MRYRSVVAAVVLLVALVGCGGGGSTSSTPVTTTPAPTAASLAVTMNGRGLIGVSPAACCSYRIKIPLTIVESGGVGANVNYARLSFIRSSVERERQEISSADIIRIAGTNHIAARATWNVNMMFDFNEDTFDTLTLTVNFTDERTNVYNFTGNMNPSNFDITGGVVSWSPGARR